MISAPMNLTDIHEAISFTKIFLKIIWRQIDFLGNLRKEKC